MAPEQKKPAPQQKKPDPAEENRRRFREALERKKAADHSHPHSDPEGREHLKGSSDARKRQFRRKSG